MFNIVDVVRYIQTNPQYLACSYNNKNSPCNEQDYESKFNNTIGRYMAFNDGGKRKLIDKGEITLCMLGDP